MVLYHNVFDVSKKVSKVDVEEIARCGHHDVIVMTITNTLQWCIVYNHMTNHVTYHIPVHMLLRSIQHRNV